MPIRACAFVLSALFAVLLAAAMPRAVSAQAASLESLTASDCAASSYDLDCPCVLATYGNTVAGMTPAQRSVATGITRKAIGLPARELRQEEGLVMLDIMSELQPVLGLHDTCKARAVAEPLSTTAREDIRGLCERSRHVVDCGCVVADYAKATSGLSPSGHDLARALLGNQLNVATSPTLEQIPPTHMVQHMATLMDALDETARTCAIATPSATTAWREASTTSTAAPTLEARASASPAESLRLWCRSGGKSAARCACEIQVQRDLMPERAFRFHGESMKAQALVELGRLQGPQRFVHATRAMGADAGEVKALHADTATALEGMSVIASNVCDVVQAQAAGAR